MAHEHCHHNDEPQVIGQMKIERIIYLALLFELVEERYGASFTTMTDAVQDELVLLCSNVPLSLAIESVNRKFNDPTFSIKECFINASHSPEKGLMS